MPTSLWGFALYAFALFPGLAFIFAREGHRPPAKRSVLRETATVVFVSVVCDSAVAFLFIIGTVVDAPLRARVTELLHGDPTWARENFALAATVFLAALAVATLLGFFLGGPWAHAHGLDALWRAPVKRDVSAWRSILGPESDADVRVGLHLRSGAWISGGVYEFDPDPDNGPHRTITLQRHLMYRAPGAVDAHPMDEAEWVVVEAADIEVMEATYFERADGSDAGGVEVQPRWASPAVVGTTVAGFVLCAVGAVASGGSWWSLGGLACVAGLICFGLVTWRAFRA